MSFERLWNYLWLQFSTRGTHTLGCSPAVHSNHLDFPVSFFKTEIERFYFSLSKFGTGKLFPKISSRNVVWIIGSQKLVPGYFGKIESFSDFQSVKVWCLFVNKIQCKMPPNVISLGLIVICYNVKQTGLCWLIE